MRIIAKAKPIRIRIKSGEEEHSSLDSLRQNLCVQDLWPLIKDKRLSRWLMQLGEVDLAHEIDALSVGQLDDSTYFKILSLFLDDDFVEHRITELYTLYSYWHDCEKRESKNYKALRNYLLTQYNGAKYLYKQYPYEISDCNWWKVFSEHENIEDPEFLFAQGKLAFEGFLQSNGQEFKNIEEGNKLIERAAELHNKDAVDFVTSNIFNITRKKAKLTTASEIKIRTLIDRWKIDQIGFKTRNTDNDDDIVSEVKMLLREFTSFWKTYNMFNREAVRDEVMSYYSRLDEDNIFYRERKFVLELVRYSVDKQTSNIFVGLAERYHYPLAQYMLHRPADNRIDGFAFAATSFPNQLRFIVDHLFTY